MPHAPLPGLETLLCSNDPLLRPSAYPSPPALHALPAEPRAPCWQGIGIIRGSLAALTRVAPLPRALYHRAQTAPSLNIAHAAIRLPQHQ